MPPKIDQSKCLLCGICQDVCPGDILHIDQGVANMVRYPDECSHCDVCRVECPNGAIDIVFPWHLRQRPVTIEPLAPVGTAGATSAGPGPTGVAPAGTASNSGGSGDG